MSRKLFPVNHMSPWCFRFFLLKTQNRSEIFNWGSPHQSRQAKKEVALEKSRIRETPTLLTDADSRTDTILERLRDLPIRTEKRTWSTQKCGLGSQKGGDSVHAKMLTWFTLRSNSRTHPRF